ncbi:MAG: DegT/DnrJ/EryC1/StrS family aminotransferase [Eubacteriales bacterium]
MGDNENLVMNAAGIAEMGFPMWPQFAPETLEDIQTPIKNGLVNYWTGPKGMQFEEMFREWSGAKMAISTTNGTAALHVGIASLGIGPGDEVLVPSYSFIASSFAVVQAGAVPIFCDVTREHTIDPKDIERKITSRTKGIVVVHLYGVVADMEAIIKIAHEHKLFVIEDVAQCIGGEFMGKKAGTIGDVGCFSFCQSKHFTTGGEGGMVITMNEDVGWDCRSFRDHGYDVRKRMNMLALEEKLPYIHNRVGYNFRMTEIQSIIGINELKRFDSWNLKRRLEFAKMYDEAFAGQKGIEALPYNDADRKNAYWWYPILLDTDHLTLDAPAVLKKLHDIKVPCYGIQWPEAYEELAYKEKNGFGSVQFPFYSKEYTREDLDYNKQVCPVAKSLRAKTVCLFLHPTWEEKHIRYCIEGLKKVLSENIK